MFKRYINKLVKDFLNIYQDEQHIRESYGNEYADRFSVVDPVTGKKKVSVPKLFTRAFIIFMVLLCLFFLIRILTYESLF